MDIALGQTVNTFIITARACSRALAEQRVVDAAVGMGRVEATAAPPPSGNPQGDPKSVVAGLHADVRVSSATKPPASPLLALRLLPVKLGNAWEAIRVEARIALMEVLALAASWGQKGKPERIAKSMV